MPSRANRSSVNCCTSRTPPSPDGEPSRPTVSPSKPLPSTQSPAKAVPVSNDTEVVIGAATENVELELGPIFEDDIAKAAAGEPAFTPVRQASTFKLRGLLLGDKSDTDDEWEHIKPRKSASTLSAVKQKLRKHLSRETTLAKRRSISSVGTTDEEIERRAELKRIRHKRIQLELSNEASYDEDAKSLSSIADADTTLGTTINSSWKPGESIPLPRLLSPSLSYPALSTIPAYPFPVLSPLDE